jgi:hypothetical protein
MIQLCMKCDKLIKEGDRVTVNVSATYHILKSTVTFALDKMDMEADSNTLRHEACNDKEGD